MTHNATITENGDCGAVEKVPLILYNSTIFGGCFQGWRHNCVRYTETLAKKFLAEQGLTWQQGIIDGSNYELIQTYKIRNWPHSLLIGPDGVLLANGLTGEELYEAVVKALAE